MPLNQKLRKVMVIGSGPIVIGQAAEFDYAGTQACRALKEEGLEVVLVNSNPATIMTDNAMADHIYVEPLTLETVKRIIKKKKPDSILSTLGGQTGLTLSMQLAKSGFLEEHNVMLLGADPDTIDKAEDRQMFKDTMEAIGQPVIPSKVVNTWRTRWHLPRKSATLSSCALLLLWAAAAAASATTAPIWERIGEAGLRLSPITQILVERCIAGWKEMGIRGDARQRKGNVITVCSMENFDPVGPYRRLHRHRPHSNSGG